MRSRKKTSSAKAVETLLKRIGASTVRRAIKDDPDTLLPEVAASEKSAALTPKQKRYAGYMGLGLTALPILGLVSNKLRTGKLLGGETVRSWLPEQVAQGAFWGAMPIAAGEVAARFPDTPKVASMSGQDLRLPITGGMKFPTDDSKGFAKKNLEESQGKAEVGPAPLMAKLKPKGPTVQDVAPKPSTSTAGSLPKIGHAMQNDPLIVYLRKQAMQVEDNHDALPQQQSETPEDPGDGQDPTMSSRQQRVGVNPHQEYLRSIFSNRKGIRQKYTQKDHPATSGQVDKILKR
jgi:hypothetical protein